MNELIEALQILMKYGNPEYPTICTHDQLYITDEIKPRKVSKEDKARLKELGFEVDRELGQFYSFRFGSA